MTSDNKQKLPDQYGQKAKFKIIFTFENDV